MELSESKTRSLLFWGMYRIHNEWFSLLFFKDEAPYEYQTKEYQTNYDDIYNQDVQQQEDAIDFLSQGLKDKQDLIGGMDVSKFLLVSKVQSIWGINVCN